MENDELKSLWNKAAEGTPVFDRDALQKMIHTGIRGANRSMIRKLLFELGMMLVLLAFATWMVFGHAPYVSGYSLSLFMLSLLFIAPNAVLFAISVWRARRFNYGENLYQSLSALLKRYTMTMRIYLVSGYVFSALILIPVFVTEFPDTDPNRLLAVRIGYVVFVAVMTLLYRPYMRWMYGGRIRDLEQQLRSLEELGEHAP